MDMIKLMSSDGFKDTLAKTTRKQKGEVKKHLQALRRALEQEGYQGDLDDESLAGMVLERLAASSGKKR
jgi:hypothetical protein